MKELLTKSENFKQEYSATVVKVGAMKDIENSDNLKQVVIDGFSVVINKNEVKEGDVMVYCKNETELNAEFLSVNNLYEIGERQLNANFEEVEQLVMADRKEEAKAMVGYFNKHGRVKMLKLRGCPSIGILLRPASLVKWNGQLADVVWEDYIQYDENGNAIPFDFDTVGGRLFIQPYVPRTNGKGLRAANNGANRKGGRFDRLVEGEWTFHYETNQLNSNMWMFKPDDIVTISCKMHGTSLVLGNVLTKKPVSTNGAIKWFNKCIEKKIKGVQKTKRNPYDKTGKTIVDKLNDRKIKNYTIGYDDMYSSRSVIKNQYIYKIAEAEELDIWGEYHKLFRGLIPEGMTIYGEIVGYMSGCQSMVQKNYDYGCPVGDNKLMIYRITKKTDGKVKEYNPLEVVEITKELAAKHEQLRRKVVSLPVLYHGRFGDLYPDIALDCHWNENVLERMKADTELLGMEKDEPMCKNKVPREGVCVRIDDDVIPQCFKLKCSKFLLKEAKEIDAGNVDMEMMGAY